MENIAIIPIGGIGIRMGTKKPKQFLLINNKPLFIYTVEKFQENKKISKIIIACKPEFKEYVINECEKYGINKLYSVTESGRTQLETIFKSVNSIMDTFGLDDKVIIHVGNRPNLSLDLIDKCIDKYDELGPITTIVPCIEGMIDTGNNKVLDRERIIRVQTPQVYSFDDIRYYSEHSNEYYNKGSTICDLFIIDDRNINFIEGELSNFKITYPEDLEMFKLISEQK